MNRREWTNNDDAQGGWRAPLTRPVMPDTDSGWPPHHATQLQRDAQLQRDTRPGAFASPHRRHADSLPPQAPQFHAAQPRAAPPYARTALVPPQPASFPRSQAASASAAGDARMLPPQPAPHRSFHAANPTGLWWLRPRAQAYGGARYYAAPASSNLAPLEGQLRDLTAQIESLRERSPAPGVIRKHPQQNLEEIVAPLMQAVPLRAIEALEADIHALIDRIETSRTSGVDPRVLAPIEHGLGEVRAIIRELKPLESVTAFKSAIRTLAELLEPTPGRPDNGEAATQVETVIAALRNVALLVASKDTLGALSEEVRGLSARLQRVMTQRAAIPESQEPAAPGPQVSAIERSLLDINQRLDALQKDVQPPADRSPETGLPADEASARNALEAAHAALSQLVDQLAGNLKGAREGKRDATAYEAPSLSGGHPDAAGHLMDFENKHDPEFSRARIRNDVPHPLEAADSAPGQSRRAIVIPVRSLVFGAVVIILAVVAARVSVQLSDIPLPAIAKADASQAPVPQQRANDIERVEVEVPDLARSQAPDHAVSPPEPPVQQSALAVGEQQNSGVIGRPVPVPAGSPASEPTLPLPDSLPAALRAEAMKGKPAAEYEVGVRLVEGKSVAVNTEEGLRWLKRAAKSGIIPAHLWIGSLYEKGLGVEKDLNLARTHYRAAAEKGNAKAMHNLAVLYAEGIDGRRDYRTAVRWFQRAAERGIADSQYNLAILLMRGIGIEQNHQDSYKWFALAALQGDREAARHRDEIGRKLEPGAVAAAQAAVRTFTPQPQPNEAVTVAAPYGGWDRASEDSRKSRSGIFARGAS